jgi:TPR repeat protein
MPGPAAAAPDEPVVFASDNVLAEWLLPYAPVLFDFAVQGGRSLAEITYRQRGYDPVTGSFTVSGLVVRRERLDLSIGSVRVGPEMTLFTDIALDTRVLGLPPSLRSAVERLENGVLKGDLLFRFRFNEARSAVDLALTADFPRAGLIEVTALLDGFHILMPLEDLEDIEDGDFSAEAPRVTGTLHRAGITYRDDGLIDLAAAMAAEDAGVTGDQLVEGVAVMPVLTVTEFLNGLPGGASEALREEALGWARLVEEALRERGAIHVSFTPPEPMPLALLQTGVLDEALLTALNPSFSRDPGQPGADAAPAGPVEAALAAIAGQGVPQNREQGAQELLGLARANDPAAYRALATAFGQGALPALEGEERAELLAALLVARASGASVSDRTLAAMTAEIGPERARRAEIEAAALFGLLPGVDGGRLAQENLAGLDARGLRAAAYDLFEGRGVVRDLTAAYAVASVAAALGDPFAASLRDDLADAARSGTAALSVADGQTMAEGLWEARSSAAPSTGSGGFGSATKPPGSSAP